MKMKKDLIKLKSMKTQDQGGMHSTEMLADH